MATEADYQRLGVWAIMLNPDQDINKRNRQRTVPAQVLSLGLSRTGTFSMHDALEILGYPTYHFSNIVANVQDADIWLEALDAKFSHNSATSSNYDYKKAFDQVIGDYSAFTDAPSVILWKELIAAYPDAKVVLVERDETKWQKSVDQLFEGTFHPAATYFLRFADPFWFGRIINCGRAWMRGFVGTTNANLAKQRAIPAYRKHYADVRAAVPKERLLEYRLGDGWEPLCDFLGKEIPHKPFPHQNEAAAMDAAFETILAKAFKRSLMNVAGVIGVGAVLGSAVWMYAVRLAVR